MQRKICHISLVLSLAVACGVATGQNSVADADAETAKINAAIQSYIAAFNARDVKKLVSHWSPEGVYLSRSTGERVVGREAMTKEFTTMFKSESVPELAGTTESIEFISPNVALERGVATVTHSKTDVVESNYSVVFVRRDGTWLIDRVTEDEIVVSPSNYQQLKDLDWLIGEWTYESDDATIEIACRWTRNQNFISRTYSVSVGDEATSSGLQIIGWDPKQKQIRSWLFDSDGGFITGTWTKREDRWVVQSVATLVDGGTGSFTSVFQPAKDGTHTWQKINRVLDGKLLPNLEKVVVRRKSNSSN